MLTYNIEKNNKTPIYMQIYSFIKNDITSGVIGCGEKLPSKRSLAENLDVSVITVENAYGQLLSEGYIESKPKKGYFACKVELIQNKIVHIKIPEGKIPEDDKKYINLSRNSVSAEDFPFSTWSKIIRKILSERNEELLIRQNYKGNITLRMAIADYLRQFKAIDVSCEQIIIGGGTENLYPIAGNILGKDLIIGIENPGYHKISQIYDYNNIPYSRIEMDNKGISIKSLRKSNAEILHLSPSHHFPSGITTPIGRRKEILNWCYEKEHRYIIEDDYDSEFRFNAKPMPSLYSIDNNNRVIYMNTFSKSVSPAVRIGYMVLPENLIKKADEIFGFMSSSVSSLEQLTMAEFINGGYFERHINKMSKVYKTKRDTIVEYINKYFNNNDFKILEKNAGLHFILKLNTKVPDYIIKEKAIERGIKLSFLSEHYIGKSEDYSHHLLVAYTCIKEEDTEKAIKILSEIFYQNF